MVEITAQYVAKMGHQFESQIRAQHPNDPKFAFLQPDNIYHRFYQLKIEETKKPAAPPPPPPPPPPGSVPVGASSSAVSASSAPSAAASAASFPSASDTSKAVVIASEARGLSSEWSREVLKELHAIRQPSAIAKEKPVRKFTVRAPPTMTPLDVEIVKLTAQFVARNGRQFLHGLVARERNNPQFDFLRSNHPLFSYFQLLVEAYTHVLAGSSSPDVVDSLKKDIETPSHILDRALSVVALENEQKRLQEAKEADEEQERIAMGLIDWHEFVVVKTIDFNDDEVFSSFQFFFFFRPSCSVCPFWFVLVHLLFFFVLLGQSGTFFTCTDENNGRNQSSYGSTTKSSSARKNSRWR